LLTATEYHLGLLKAKLAKYRAQLLEPSGKTGAKVSGRTVYHCAFAELCWILHTRVHTRFLQAVGHLISFATVEVCAAKTQKWRNGLR